MDPIVKIDGISVYSNKPVRSITNSRISFSDGSWCDVLTGQIVNKGEGFITIGQPPAGVADGNEQEMWGPRSFPAARLFIRRVRATVDIEPHDKESIIVEMTGTKSALASIQVVQQGDTLSISPNESVGSVSSINISIGSLSSSSVSFNSAVGEKPRITVKVPHKCPIQLSAIEGICHVGDTYGSIKISTQDSDKVEVGCVDDTTVSSDGSGDITIQEVVGSLNVDINDRGSVSVAGGEVTSLQAKNDGAGTLTFGGRARIVACSLNDRGSIHVNHGTDIVHARSSGSGQIVIQEAGGELNLGLSDRGSISISKGEATSLTAKNDGSGNIRFGGRAQTATLIAEDRGNIEVAHVVRSPSKRRSGRGDIRVVRIG